MINSINIFAFFLILVHITGYASEERMASSAFTRLISLSATSDVSSSSLKNSQDGITKKITNFSLPYETPYYQVNERLAINDFVSLGYINYSTQFEDFFRMKWSSYSIILGGNTIYKLNDGLILKSRMAYGYSELVNRNKRSEGYIINGGKGDLTGWRGHALIISPAVSLEHKKVINDKIITSTPRLSYTMLRGLGNDKKINLNHGVASYSVKEEILFPDQLNLSGRSFDVFHSYQLGGFYGSYNDSLGFEYINELRSGVEFKLDELTYRLSAAYFYGDKTHGVGFSLNIK